MALGTLLAVGTGIEAAKADPASCPPGAQCAPGDTHKPTGSGDQGVPAQGTNQVGRQGAQDQSGTMDWRKRHRGQNQGSDQAGQDQSGNTDWKKRHRGNQGGDQMGQDQSGNMDWKHRRRHDNGGVDVGVGIYLGDGYDNNGYDNGYYGHRRHYGYVSCGEAGGIVRASGFRHVRTQSCAPGRYRFMGSRRGTVFEIAVSGRGRIVAVNPAY